MGSKISSDDPWDPSIEVGIDIPVGLDDIMVDAHQLDSAILNVVVNSRDAMPTGGAMFISARGAEIAAGNDQRLPEGAICLPRYQRYRYGHG